MIFRSRGITTDGTASATVAAWSHFSPIDASPAGAGYSRHLRGKSGQPSRPSERRRGFDRDRDEVGRLQVRIGVDEAFEHRQRQCGGREHRGLAARCPAAAVESRAFAVQRDVALAGDAPDDHGPAALAEDAVLDAAEQVLDLPRADVGIEQADRRLVIERPIGAPQPRRGFLLRSRTRPPRARRCGRDGRGGPIRRRPACERCAAGPAFAPASAARSRPLAPRVGGVRAPIRASCTAAPL